MKMNIKQQIEEYRNLCEKFRKKKKYYQFFDLRQRHGVITVLWYGIHKDLTGTMDYLLRSSYKIFKRSEIQKEIEIMKQKLNE